MLFKIKPLKGSYIAAVLFQASNHISFQHFCSVVCSAMKVEDKKAMEYIGASSKRDLVAEYESEQKNQPTAAIGAKRPRTIDKLIEEVGEVLTLSVPGYEPVNFLGAVDVHLEEAGISYAKEKPNDAMVALSDITKIVSTYHLAGILHKQSPVYKAITSDDVYLFYFGGYGEQGWYISTQWFWTCLLYTSPSPRDRG